MFAGSSAMLDLSFPYRPVLVHGRYLGRTAYL